MAGSQTAGLLLGALVDSVHAMCAHMIGIFVPIVFWSATIRLFRCESLDSWGSGRCTCSYEVLTYRCHGVARVMLDEYERLDDNMVSVSFMGPYVKLH
jgi:hypothetical protein